MTRIVKMVIGNRLSHILAFERAQTNDLQLVLGGATQGNLDKPDDDDPQWQVQQIVILGERVSGVP
jgi:hypothetical protein